MTQTVEIDGTVFMNVLDVSYSGQGTDELGTAKVLLSKNATSLQVEYGSPLEIRRDGQTEFVGNVEKKPSSSGGIGVEVTARDRREALKFSEVHRPFYQKNTGLIIRTMVEEKSQQLPEKPLVAGDDLETVESTFPVNELGDLPNKNLHNYGTDFLYAFLPEGANGEYRFRFSDLDPNVIRSDRLVWVKLRYLVNATGDQFSGELELRDDDGINYVWDLELPDTKEFTEREYRAEKATPENAVLTEDNTLEFRVALDGELPEDRAVAFDYAGISTYAVEDRNLDIDPSGVPDTDRDITRRLDETLFASIAQFAEEEDAVSYVDQNDVLYYESSGDTPAPGVIDYNTTRVTEFNVNRDATDIVNKVTLRGADDLQVTMRESASIEFYGVSERSQPKTNEKIQTREELVEWGENYLSDEAWEDGAVEATVAEPAFRNTRPGQAISVVWPPEDILQTFTVGGVENDATGRTKISMSGSP